MTTPKSKARLKKQAACPKKVYQKVSFDLKLTIIDKINNGQISINRATKVYNISRSSIDYWMKKLSTFAQMIAGT